MVIRYRPASRPDLLGVLALIDVAALMECPIILGAWMTRLWTVARGSLLQPRKTSDVDVGISSELKALTRMVPLLRAKGYEQDTGGYPFRFHRLTGDGVVIVDLLIDEKRATPGEPAYPVYGLDFAAEQLQAFDLDLGSAGNAHVCVPTLDRAFVLRCLALEDAGSIKFEDYVRDAWSLAQLVDTDAAATARLEQSRDRDELRRASGVIARLFENERSAAIRAVRRSALGDPEVVARRASATMRRLLPT